MINQRIPKTNTAPARAHKQWELHGRLSPWGCLHWTGIRFVPVLTFIATVAGILLIYFSTSMAEFDPEPGTQDDDIPLISDEQEIKVDQTHQKASQLLVSAADWLDSFYDDERYSAEENTTRGKFSLSFGYSRIDGYEFSPKVRVRLKLPKLSKKALLIIGASDDDDFDTNSNPIQDDPRNDDNEKSDLSATLRYFLKVGKRYNFSTDVGVSWTYAYAGLRYRYERNAGSWLWRTTNNLKYYTDDGFEDRFNVDVERYFLRHWFFRTSVGVNWFEHEDGLPHSLSFRLYQVLDRQKALLYEFSNFFNTEPDYTLTDLQLRLRYRQRFYRDWMVLEVAPQLTFPYDYDRDPNPGIVIRLEAEFGYMGEKDVFKKVFGF